MTNDLVKEVALKLSTYVPPRGTQKEHNQLAMDLIAIMDGSHGWTLVPNEPTEMMRTKGHAEGVRADGIWQDISQAMAFPLNATIFAMALRFLEKYLPDAYRAMLAARPDPLGEDDEQAD